MENKGNTSVQGKPKSNLPSSNRKSRGVSLDQEKSYSSSKRTSEKEDCDFSTNVDGDKKREESLIRKRPSTVSENYRRRSDRAGNKNPKGSSNKSWDRGSAVTTSTASKTIKHMKSKFPSSNRASSKPNKENLTEFLDSCSCLSLAIEAQRQTIATLRLLREALRKKIKETRIKLQSGAKAKENAVPSAESSSYSGSSACFFESSYASYLDEILQAWINLLYLITNLKITLCRVVEVSEAKGFKPDLETEKAVITQATECVKFFSQLKMKSLMEGFEEVKIEDSKMKKFEILDFEDRISASFFSELETLSKKAKEMVDQLKGDFPNDVN